MSRFLRWCAEEEAAKEVRDIQEALEETQEDEESENSDSDISKFYSKDVSL